MNYFAHFNRYFNALFLAIVINFFSPLFCYKWTFYNDTGYEFIDLKVSADSRGESLPLKEIAQGQEKNINSGGLCMTSLWVYGYSSDKKIYSDWIEIKNIKWKQFNECADHWFKIVSGGMQGNDRYAFKLVGKDNKTADENDLSDWSYGTDLSIHAPEAQS